MCIRESELGVINPLTRSFCEQISGGKLSPKFEERLLKEEKKKDF